MRKLTLVKMSAIVLSASLIAVLILASAPAVLTAKELKAQSEGALVIEKQGSLFVGGTIVQAPGTFNPNQSFNPFINAGQTFQIEQLYASFQIPTGARNLPIVFVHGLGHTGASWESTPDGRDGYQTIFLRQGFSVYNVDLPRQGRAGFPSFNGTLGNLSGTQVIPDATTAWGDQAAFVTFRFGPSYSNYFPNTQFPTDSLEEYLSQKVPSAMAVFPDVVAPALSPVPGIAANALAALFDKIGPAILVTHSQSGLVGWLAAAKSSNIKAIIAYEPIHFAFQQGEVPPSLPLSNGVPLPPGVAISPADFSALTSIPIQVVYGDNIPASPDPNLLLDGWRLRNAYAGQFADAVNGDGGDASVLLLPEAGLSGNTHFPFSDLNNLEVAELLSQFLRVKRLDKRGH